MIRRATPVEERFEHRLRLRLCLLELTKHQAQTLPRHWPPARPDPS